MAQVVVKVDNGRVAVSLTAFSLGLKQKESLLRAIGAGQLVSIYKTFDDEGSPAGSWPRLSPVSLRWHNYSSGHKLLIGRGRLRNSIGFTVEGDSVTLGSQGVPYAGVQFGGFDGTQNVKSYSYTRHVKANDRFERSTITNKAGRQQSVRRKTASGITQVTVRAFTRHIKIPARNPLVFRPEDPSRIEVQVRTFIANAANAAGMGTV